MKNKYSALALSLALVAGTALALPALAADNKGNGPGQRMERNEDRPGRPGLVQNLGQIMRNKKPGQGLIGTVSAINGTTLTVVGQFGPSEEKATTTYTVDASKAQIFKNRATSTITSIAVGDKVDVQGTVSGTNISATTIFDGLMRGQDKDKEGKGWERASSTYASSTYASSTRERGPRTGFFRGVGNFFFRLFGR